MDPFASFDGKALLRLLAAFQLLYFRTLATKTFVSPPFQSIILLLTSTGSQMFSVLNEIRDNSHFRTTSVVGASIGSAASTYILVAITGYLSFGNNVGGNIIGVYPPSVTSTIGRAAIVVLVMFSYPLQVHPCRASVDAVLKWRWNPRSTSNAPGTSPNRNPLLPRPNRGPNRGPDSMGDTRFAAITTAIIVLSYIVAMTVSSLEAVLAYVGSTGSTSISFILPGLFYYKISSPESDTHQRLMKEDDEAAAAEDDLDGDSDEEGSSGQGLLSGSGLLGRSTRQWRRNLLRKLSLALAIYGVIVMFVCLVTNTFFIASH